MNTDDLLAPRHGQWHMKHDVEGFLLPSDDLEVVKRLCVARVDLESLLQQALRFGEIACAAAAAQRKLVARGWSPRRRGAAAITSSW